MRTSRRLPTMGLFFFNQAGALYDPDVDGFEFETIAEARVQAVKFAAETLRDRPELAWQGEEYRVEVTDEKQLILFTFVAMGVDSPAVRGMFPRQEAFPCEVVKKDVTPT